ncbi:MAG: hypothetical protein MUF48_21000, partial [Pirellulaceae bacterium]|nr:hypothetical protein [Pirellulaceae bacterium]
MSTSQLVSRRRRRALNRRYRTALFLEPLEMRRLLTSWPVWEPVGPTPVTGGLVDGMFMQQNPVAGGVHTLAPHPSDANVMYVGTVGGGVWKTTSALDTQPTWRPLTDFVQVSQNLGGGEYDYVPSSISALVFDTADATHQTLYAGIGALSSSMPRYMFGVVRTTDGGESWEHIVDAGGAPVGLDVSGLAVNGDQIIVGGLSVLGDLDPPARLWYSVDGGESFVAADHPHHEYFRDVSDILADPADPHIVYVAELFTEAADNQPATQSGIYRINSTQGVWTFEDISDHSDELGMATAMATSNSVKLAAGRNGELYVGIMNAGRMESLFRTNDARAADVDWQRVRLPSYEEGGQFAIALHSDVHDQRKQSVPFSVAVDPTDPWVVYLGGDRQPGDLFTPPDDEFSEGGMNAVGAAHKTGRLLRGQIIHDADGRIVTTVWQGVTHAGAVPAGTPSDPVQGASNELPIRVHSPGHGLSDGDRVMVYDVSGNTAANGLWTVTPNGADHFLLDGADGQASAPHVAGTGRWLRYEGGSAPGRNAHDLAFDNAGNLIVACDGGVYRKADPRSPIGSWQSLHGNLQIADTSSIAWDHNQHVASGTVVGAGVAIQNVRDQKAWGLLEGSGSQLYAVSDGAQDRTVYYFGQAQLGNLKRKTIDLAAETSEVVDVELRVDALAFDDDGNLAPAGLALQAFDYGFDRRDDGSLRGLPTLVASPVNPDRFAVFVGEILYESTDGGAILRPLQEIIDNNSNNRDDDGDGQIDDGNEFLPNRPSARLTAAAYGELGPQGADAQDALYYADTDGHNGHIYLRRPGQSDLQLVYEFPDHRIWQLLVDPRDWHHVFAVILNGDVMESSDAGGTWVSTIRIPSSYEIGELVFVTAPFSDELIMWSDQQGLLAMLHAPLQESRDSSWLQVAGNLPVAVGANKVADVDYDRRDDTLVVATAGRGAWKLPHASQLLTVPARTGDITELDLDPLLRGSDYRLTEVAMRATQAGSRYFSITGDADQGYQLRRVLDEAGHFARVATLWSPRELEEDANGTPGPTFGDSGRLYLEPSLVNNLLDDSDADERGFQGQMELTFTYRDRTGQERTATLVLDVAAGCSGSVATSITMNVTRLDNLRLAHRLRYLGELALMPENQGNGGGEAEPPPLAPDVAAALRLFQSVIDTHGELLPGDASGELSFH